MKINFYTIFKVFKLKPAVSTEAQIKQSCKQWLDWHV